MQRSTQNPVDATKFSSLKLTKAIFLRFGRTVDTKRSPFETHCCALDGASFKRYSVVLATSQEMLSIEEISMYLIKSVAPKAFLAFGILLNVIFSIGVAGRLSCSNISINRDKVVHGVHLVFAADFADWGYVMHLDDAREFGPVCFGEIETADGADCSIGLQARLPCAAASLVAVRGDVALSAFGEQLGRVFACGLRCLDCLLRDAPVCLSGLLFNIFPRVQNNSYSSSGSTRPYGFSTERLLAFPSTTHRLR